jgi:hypothetical protein
VNKVITEIEKRRYNPEMNQYPFSEKDIAKWKIEMIINEIMKEIKK